METTQFKKEEKYIMLALDHRGSFKKLLNPESPDTVTEEEASALKARILAPLKDKCSGVLIDPTYGLPAYRSVFGSEGNLPYLLSLEESGYDEKEGDRYSKLQYKAQQIKEWGAEGTKLLLYFDPEGKSAEHQINIAKQALEDSHAAELPLFLEIVTYGKGRGEDSAGKSTLQAMQQLLERNIKPDVWKLEFPGNAELATQVTEMAGETPWILLTRGASFDDFTKELEIAVQAGAVGFLAGRAVWQEIMDFTGEEQEKFLQETVPQRFEQISQIVLRG